MDGLESFKVILERLISFPLKSQIKIDFDLKEKVFRLAVPVISSNKALSPAIKKYVEERKGKAFKPHATSFLIEEDKRVVLIQEFPFQWGFQPTNLRDQICEFCHLAKKCHSTLMELGVEETYSHLYTQLD